MRARCPTTACSVSGLPGICTSSTTSSMISLPTKSVATGSSARIRRSTSDAAVRPGLARHTIAMKGRRFLSAPTRCLRELAPGVADPSGGRRKAPAVALPPLSYCRGIQTLQSVPSSLRYAGQSSCFLRSPLAAPGVVRRTKTGAGGRTRTGTEFLPTDFKSVAATITPRPPNQSSQAFAPSCKGGVNCRPMSQGR